MISERLEFLSNKVRRGIPLSMDEVSEVIIYQQRKMSLIDRIISWYYYQSGRCE